MTMAGSCVRKLTTLTWPADLDLPTTRFRLFVAADVNAIDVDTLAKFATMSIQRGMGYFCAWGPGCERFHDIVDEVVVGNNLQSSSTDTIMTRWHDKDTLENALEFFAKVARPADELLANSAFWLAFSLHNPEWEARIREQLTRLLPS